MQQIMKYCVVGLRSVPVEGPPLPPATTNDLLGSRWLPPTSPVAFQYHFNTNFNTDTSFKQCQHQYQCTIPQFSIWMLTNNYRPLLFQHIHLSWPQPPQMTSHGWHTPKTKLKCNSHGKEIISRLVGWLLGCCYVAIGRCRRW